MHTPVFVFDIDDTLYDRCQPFEKACEDLFPGKYTSMIRPLFLARSRRGDEVFEPAQSGQITMEEMYIYRLTKAFSDCHASISPEESLQFEKRYQYYQTQISMSPTIIKILDYLKKNEIPLALLTNGPSRHQRIKIEALRLKEYVPEDHWCISAEIGFSKPHLNAFRAVEQALNTTPDQIWYVGDSYEKDVIGAKQAGWNVFWYNPDHLPLEETAASYSQGASLHYPDYIATNPDLLFEQIKSVMKTFL